MSARLLSLVLSAALAACSPPSGSSQEPEVVGEPAPLTAEHLANLIAADGARHTVLVLTGPADPTGIDKVFAGVATGEAGWLALVPEIRPELNAGDAERLQAALGTALIRNAPGVLALIPDHARPETVCAPTGPPEARAAVKAVTRPELQAARTECLRSLDGRLSVDG